MNHLKYLYEIRAVQVLSDNPEYFIIQQLSGPIGARLKEFYCNI